MKELTDCRFLFVVSKTPFMSHSLPEKKKKLLSQEDIVLHSGKQKKKLETKGADCRSLLLPGK